MSGLRLPGGGANGGIPMSSGKYFNPNGTGATATTAGNSRAVMNRVLFGKACTLDRIALDITIVGQAASVFRFGIYADADGKPGARIADLGTVAADALGSNPLTISQAVLAQWYWFCVAAQGQTPTLATFRSSNSAQVPWGVAHIGYAAPGGAALNAGYFYDTGFSGALPDPAGTETGAITVSNSPALWLRAV